ncbi:hypothetical protein NP233_g4855 [Leucocoprinus birnbaumii]|uniref:Uncharacterized protein n=1 Tax=Leucocoprinus birnbaumii TaxID=56174 RepID=A0AAD5VU14_9AGAR|nr:hypothetical protein NP233_g4855 [Leucocoprinus birnbaumii]
MTTSATSLNVNVDEGSIHRPISPLPSLSSKKVGFVGLGNMGYLMARNLARGSANFFPSVAPILLWNRTESKAHQLVKEVGQDKARVARDLEEVALECDVIITNLANDNVVKTTYEHFVATLSDKAPTQQKVFIETSTVYPTLSGELDKILSQISHTHLVTCPVVGAPAAADKAQLVLLMSGDYSSKKLVNHLLVPAVGRKAMDLGEDLEKAPTFKLIVNSLVLGNIELLAEAFTVATKAGIDGQNITTIVGDFFPAPSLIGYADKILHEKFDGDAGFNIDGGIKDAAHIRQLTEQLNSPMPVIDVAHQHLLTARALHEQRKQDGDAKFQRLDWSGLVAGTRAAAGLSGFDRSKDTSVFKED